MKTRYILALDSGTTGTTAIIVDDRLNLISKWTEELPQIYPRPGWVEHNPEEIYNLSERVIEKVIANSGIKPAQIACLGITNQRETTILYNRDNLKPYHNAIVWQCRRTASLCEKLKKKGLEKEVRRRTGLLIDPYFSATKIMYLLETVKGLDKEAEKGNVAFGTVDTYLLSRFTGGKVHATDYSNASRTMLFNIHQLKWDNYLCDKFSIPMSILPHVKDSCFLYGYTKGMKSLPDGIPITGIAGDQQSATFGQMCFSPGEAKCTYGTGSFTVFNTGERIVNSGAGLLTTILWGLNGKIEYALEGSVFIAGAGVQWLRDGLGIIKKSDEVEVLAGSVKSSEGVYFVPALQGLGAPYWRSDARGVIYGITRSTTASHIARALLEGIAYMNAEVMMIMEKESRKKIKTLKVDGGASKNDLLMQFQADIMGIEIVRPFLTETTAFGVALIAGLGAGIWNKREELLGFYREEKRFKPSFTPSQRKEYMRKWKEVVKKSW